MTVKLSDLSTKLCRELNLPSNLRTQNSYEPHFACLLQSHYFTPGLRFTVTKR